MKFRDYLKEKAQIAFDVPGFDDFEAFIESNTDRRCHFMNTTGIRWNGPSRFEYYGRSFYYNIYTTRLIKGRLVIRGDKNDLHFRFSWNPISQKGNCFRTRKET